LPLCNFWMHHASFTSVVGPLYEVSTDFLYTTFLTLPLLSTLSP